ncbi:MAG: DUF1028 domain-containing protein [Planctomycetota bacterium]|nr:MAG: DUF1028 domain-containing protein [Planctomycetota bacterium]
MERVVFAVYGTESPQLVLLPNGISMDRRTEPLLLWRLASAVVLAATVGILAVGRDRDRSIATTDPHGPPTPAANRPAREPDPPQQPPALSAAFRPHSPNPDHGGREDVPATTFSICARDPQTGELGVAVTTRVTQVGRLCPFVKVGVGAVSTQALVRVEYGPRALELLERGTPPQQVIDTLLADDRQREHRQLGIVSADGRTAAFTGDACLPFAAHRIGPNYTVQGNLLVGPEVLDAVEASFRSTEGSGFPLADRLLLALQAGQRVGGDKRSGRKQSAALVVAHPERSFYGRQPWLSLHVAEHPTPVRELRRQYDAIFQRLGHRTLVWQRGRDVVELKAGLAELGYLDTQGHPLAELIRREDFPDFDRATARAVDAFRAAHGLPTPDDGLGHESGVVDETFVRVFKRALANHRRGPAEPAPPPLPAPPQ